MYYNLFQKLLKLLLLVAYIVIQIISEINSDWLHCSNMNDFFIDILWQFEFF